MKISIATAALLVLSAATASAQSSMSDDAAEAARAALPDGLYQKSVQRDCSTSSIFCKASLPKPPAGKLVTLQKLSCLMTISPANAVALARVYVAGATAYAGLLKAGEAGGRSLYTAEVAGPMTGSTIRIELTTDVAAQSTIECSGFGKLIDG